MATELDELRVDHVGSLSRPQPLLDLQRQVDDRKASLDDLRAEDDRAISAIVARQEAIGFPIVNDGEFRRRNFQDSFGACVSGYESSADAQSYDRSRRIESDKPGRVESGLSIAGPPILTRRATVKRLRLVQNLPLDEYRFVRDIASTPAKVTLIGPDRVAQRFDWQRSKGVYDGLYDFQTHVVSIERQLVKGLADAGCRYIQIDAPGYTAYVDEPSLAAMRARGEDPNLNLEKSIEADNAVIDAFPHVTFGIHLCRGNERSVDPKTGQIVPLWHREGHYDAIAERLFAGLHHKRLLLEYDSDRAGTFEPLRFVPRGTIVVLGLVTTKSNEVEAVDGLLRSIDEASRYVPIDQLALSPQCGFASGSGRTISGDIQWRKLEVLLEVARQVWG